MKFKFAHLYTIVLCFSLISCFKNKELPPDQLTIEVQNIDKVVVNDLSNYVAYHSSGIRLAVHSFGEGNFPHNGQSVAFKYSGTSLSDPTTVIDTGSYTGFFNNIPIKGLQIAMGILPVGSNSLVYVPSAYAYGSSGKGKIPGNTTLVYELQSLSVTKTAAEQAQFNKDTAAIHKYLIDHNIDNAILHPTGIWYTVITEGTGDKPKLYDRITSGYKGSLLSNGSVFDQGTLTNQGLSGLIDGFKIAIPLLKTGTKAVLYIPSGLGYGSTAVNGIPANSILVFEIDLQSFNK